MELVSQLNHYSLTPSRSVSSQLLTKSPSCLSTMFHSPGICVAVLLAQHSTLDSGFPCCQDDWNEPSYFDISSYKTKPF